MSTTRFFKNWFAAFVVLILTDLLWHRLLFDSFYSAELAGFARSEDGALAPLAGVMLFTDLLASLGYSYFITLASRVSKKYVRNGALLGLTLVGFFTLHNTALFREWHISLTAADAVFGLVAGTIQGVMMKFMNRNE